MTDPLMKHTGSDVAFQNIKSGLAAYLRSGKPNFEQIYHCAHELIFTFPPTVGAFDEFKPILQPFMSNITGIKETALRSLCEKIVQIIFSEFSLACDNALPDFDTFGHFMTTLSANYITRCYTTNYDDFVLRASPGLYTGFAGSLGDGPRKFELNRFWRKENTDSVFHLHGSVHMGFPHPPAGAIGELFWFNSRAEATKYSSFSGSSPSKMDGTAFLRTTVITGLEKLSRLQQQPFSHFYAAMARDAMRADVIFVIGSGLTDLHLNSWLAQSRLREPRPPLLFIDYWKDGFEEETRFENESKTIKMFYDLRIHISQYEKVAGWTISDDHSAAVWDKGFQAFLADPGTLQKILSVLKGGAPSPLACRLLRRVHGT